MPSNSAESLLHIQFNKSVYEKEKKNVSTYDNGYIIIIIIMYFTINSVISNITNHFKTTKVFKSKLIL